MSGAEGLGRGLSVELAPVRVNAVAPGTVDGNLWSNRPAADRDAAFAQYRRDALLGRPAAEDAIAQAVVFLFTNGFTTGSTLDTEGGYTLRQLCSSASGGGESDRKSDRPASSRSTSSVLV